MQYVVANHKDGLTMTILMKVYNMFLIEKSENIL